MKSATGYAGFSFTAIWAKIGETVDAVVKSSRLAPLGVEVELPVADRNTLNAHLTPVVKKLERMHLETLSTVDRGARIAVPLAGVLVFTALFRKDKL